MRLLRLAATLAALGGASALPAAPAASTAAGKPTPAPAAMTASKAPPSGAIQALDLNGDGHVSRDEYQVGTRLFQRLDKDKNGIVTRAEIPAGPDGDRARDMFAKWDANQDGQATRDEFKAWQDADFARLDANHDGVLSSDEARPGQGTPGLGSLDKNGDGIVTADEFANGSTLFTRFDTDGDGILHFKDMPAASDAAAARKRFDELDLNHDGAVTRDEVVTARRKLFEKLDANGDGKLTPDELKSLHQDAPGS